MDTTPEFPNVQAGRLPVGTITSRGMIFAVSLTAYHVRPGATSLEAARQYGQACEWVPFQVLHGRPAPVMPLVVFG